MRDLNEVSAEGASTRHSLQLRRDIDRSTQDAAVTQRMTAEVCASVPSQKVPRGPHRGRLGMNVRFYSPLKSIRGLSTWPFAALFAAPFVASLVACSSPVVLPAPLGDCTGTKDASCASSAYGGGGTTTTFPMEAGMTSEDDTGATSTVDAGSCGLGTLLINPANSGCLPCISLASTLGCCMAAQACSTDPTCQTQIQCASLGALATCTVGQDSTTVQFVQCLERNCPSVCSDIVFQLSEDQ